MAAGYFPSGRAAGRRRQKDTALLTLLLPLAHHVARLPNKPPVTLGLVALMVGLYLRLPGLDFAPPTAAACLQPRRVLEGREWDRLLWSGLLHADDMHIYYNMASFLWKGVVLEPAIGSARFAALVAELLLVSQMLLTLAAAALAAAVPALFASSYRSTCAVGFSGVLFALKVVLNARSPNMETIYGMRIPAKYVAWVELVIISLVTPNASFLGHLAGILAGLFHIVVIDRSADRARRQLQWLVGRFRRSFTGTPRYAQRSSNRNSNAYSSSRGGTRSSSRANAGSASTSGNGAAAAAATGSSLGDPPPEDEGPAAVRDRVRRQRERYFAQQGLSGAGSGASIGCRDNANSGRHSGDTGSGGGGGLNGATGGGGHSGWGLPSGLGAWRPRRRGSGFQDPQRQGWPLVGTGQSGAAAAAGIATVLAAAWAAKPTPESFATHIASFAHRGLGKWSGLAVQRLLRLQAASGFGLRFYDLGVFVLARHQGLWFGGAFGRWVLLPSPWLLRPLLPSASTALALAFAAVYLLRRCFLHPAAAVRHLEAGPGCWPTAFLLAGLHHGSAASTAAACVFLLAAGRQLEAAAGGGARLLAVYFAGGAAVYAAAWAAHTLGGNRRRLWAAHHGSAVPIAALLAFAALHSPGATLLTVPAPPALGDLAGAASGIASGGAAGLSRHMSEYAQRSFVSALWPSWLPQPKPASQSRRSGVKTRSRGSGGNSGGGILSSHAQRSAQARGQAQAGSRALHHTGTSSNSGGSSRHISPSAAAGSPGGPAAPALLPARLGGRQLLAAMATPPLLSLVPVFLAWAIASPRVFGEPVRGGASGQLRQRLGRVGAGHSGGTAASRRAAAALEDLTLHAMAVAAGAALYSIQGVLPQ